MTIRHITSLHGRHNWHRAGSSTLRSHSWCTSGGALRLRAVGTEALEGLDPRDVVDLLKAQAELTAEVARRIVAEEERLASDLPADGHAARAAVRQCQRSTLEAVERNGMPLADRSWQRDVAAAVGFGVLCERRREMGATLRAALETRGRKSPQAN